MRTRKIISLIIIAVIAVNSSLFIASCKKEEPQPFNFRILLLSDLHYFYSLDLWRNTNAMITQLIGDTDPDLIIINGDLVMEGPGNIELYTDLLAFLDSFKTPYAITFGNHDSEIVNNRAELAALCETGEYSVFKAGPDNIYGYGNYIYNLSKSDDSVAWSLIMMDSNDYIDRNTDNDYDCIRQDQIDWYTSEVTTLKENNGGSLNSLLFFHIPLQEQAEAWDAIESGGAELILGEKRKGVSCSDIDNGFFEVIKSLDSTRGVFSGHDHTNNYAVKYEGIILAYGLKTGYGSYGDLNMHGGTVIDLTENDFTIQHVFLETN
jgi:3',5'-cyclic AMP phosphodiesterase CpdA